MKETGLLRGMVDSDIGTGKLQNEPGVFYSAIKWDVLQHNDSPTIIGIYRRDTEAN